MYSDGIIELDELDSRVDAFESMRLSQGHAELTSFLPDDKHPRYCEIATELVRVDMELSWDDGQRNSLEYYCQLIPALLGNPAALEKVAFEDYRLKSLHGVSATPEDYQRKYGFSTTNWSRHHFKNPEKLLPDSTSLSKTLTSAWSNVLQLAEEVTDFPECKTYFAGFWLESEIGRGAFARVYLARQGELADRYVVLKVARGRSLEPQHLARLQHTNIVPIYSVHQADRLTVVCMPYLGKRTLADFVRGLIPKEGLPRSGQALLSTINFRDDNTAVYNSTSLNEAEASRIDLCTAQIEQISKMSYVEAVTRVVSQIAEGLQHAHRRGIVHRDLKLANILLSDDGNPLILDFNLSEEVLVNGPTALAVGGTLPYMAPEHLNALIHGGGVDSRSDIFSLGVIYFELLTGAQPFPIRRGALELIVEQMVTDRQSSPVGSLPLNISTDIKSIISRCLEPDIAARYQSVAEVLEDLTCHQADLPLRHAANISWVDRAKKWARRHPRISSATSVATVAAVLFLGSAWFSLRLWANNSYQQFEANLSEARAALSIAENDVEMINDGMNATHAALEYYGISDKAEWNVPLKYWLLDSSKKIELNSALAELSYQMAAASQRLGKLESKDLDLINAKSWNELATSLLAGKAIPQAFERQRAELLQASEDANAVDGFKTVESEKSVPTSSLDQTLLAQRQLGQKQFDVVMPLVTELRDQNPRDPVVWLMLGNTYAGKGSLERADECYSTAAALLPTSYWAVFQRGRCRMDMQNFELAVEDFDSMLRTRKKVPSYVLLNRGLAHAALGNHAAAIADYTTALDQGAPYTRIYFLRARSFEQIDDPKSASKDFDMGLELTPTDEESWIARGIARLTKDPEGALADFREAIKLNPNSLSALQNIVHVTADVLDRDMVAMESLNRILEIESQNADALAGRAVLFARRSDRVKALADLGSLLKVSQQPVHLFQASCALSLISHSNGIELPRAMRFLSIAVMQDPRLAVRAKDDKDLTQLRKLPEFTKLIELVTPPPPK